MRQDMPDKDITLGEVYRAVLSLRDEFIDTRVEIKTAHDALRNDLAAQGLELREAQVKIKAFEEFRRMTENRITSLERVETPKSSDPLARVGAGLGAGLTLLASWWMSRGGN
jgi:hypothetical protein